MKSFLPFLLFFSQPAQAATPVDQLLQGSWLLTDHDDDEFTGFPLRIGNGVVIMTAHHGPSVRESCAPNSFEPQVPASQPALGARRKMSLRFRPTSARECDYGHDAVFTAGPADVLALELQPAEDPLRFREKVAIAGYPGKRFRAHECVLAGIRPALNNARLAHYVLECGSVNYDVGGMSGGPVISLRTGRVIGFVNAQGVPGSSGYKRIYVTPLSAIPGGGLAFGIRHFLSSVDCFNRSGLPAGTCTVNENGVIISAPWARGRR